jgi:DNA polymerase-3 subunit alpha
MNDPALKGAISDFVDVWNEASPEEREKFLAQYRGGSLRYSLAAIKGVGEAAAQSIVDERKRNGPYLSVADFARRLDTKAVNKRALEGLISAGALDCLNPNRAELLGNIDTIMDMAKGTAQKAATGEGTIVF